ncbi:MAG: hypothetical protein AB7H97_10470 [Pseudobdellovibrionaceae bacterium]
MRTSCETDFAWKVAAMNSPVGITKLSFSSAVGVFADNGIAVKFADVKRLHRLQGEIEELFRNSPDSL